MRLFTERGYEATRIADIIEAVGVSEATFFNYFPTKAALLDQSAAEFKGYYRAFLQHLVAREGEPTADRIRGGPRRGLGDRDPAEPDGHRRRRHRPALRIERPGQGARPREQ